MKIKILFLLLPIFALASGGKEADYDIVERSINFIMSAALFYFLVAEHLKNYFKSRKEAIASQLSQIDNQLNKSRQAKLDAENKVKKTKQNVESLIQTAKREVEILKQRVQKQTEDEIKLLDKSLSDRISFERRNMVRKAVEEIIDEIFSKDSLKLNQDKLVDIILKKAA